MAIRFRLTLWYVSLLAGILIIFSAGLYGILTFSLRDQVDRTLESRAVEIQSSLIATLEAQRDPVIYFARGGITILPSANAFATSGVFVELETLDGQPVWRSDNGSDLMVPTSVIEQASHGIPVFTNLTVSDVPLRLYVAPLELPRRNVGTETVGVIELAMSLQGVEDTSRRLATLLGIGIISGLAFASIVGALLARSALAPIDRIVAMAESITRAGDLTRRIDPPRTQDEVGHLVGTFNEMLARIEELFRAQQRFVSDVSHELRSPLTAIRGNLDLLRLGAVDNQEERKQVFSALDGEAERMQRLVADLLILARADEGFKIQKQLVELDTLFLQVYAQAKVMARGGMQVKLGNFDQARVMGDPDRLKQLLLNLVDNAIKYTPAGGEIKLALERDEHSACVSVTDTGIGIPQSELGKIFDRLYRVDKARARVTSNGDGSTGGSGLGLAIAKWIAEAHGGTIRVQSEVGHGSTFTLVLPLARAEPLIAVNE